MKSNNTSKMKYAFTIPSILLILMLSIGCSKKEDNLTLEDKRSVLDTKKKELVALQLEIDSLTAQIAAEDPNLKERPKYVSTQILASGLFERYVNIQGNVTADDLVNVVSEVPGRLISVAAKEGQYVQRGQVIAKLDLEGINKQLAEIETALSLAKDVYERQDRLWKQGIGSEVQYLQAKNNVDRLEKSLETVSYQLTKATIYAPISGVVDREVLKSGEVAAPGMPIIQLLNTSNLKITADLPERYLTIAQKGSELEMNFPSLNKTMSGRISMLGRSIDPANRTLSLEITPIGSTKELKPNLLTELKIKELSIKDVIKIPVEYILQEVDGNQYVYIAEQRTNKEWRAKKAYVQTGESAEGQIIITAGLKDGDTLVTKGTRTISENELLEIKNETISNNGK